MIETTEAQPRWFHPTPGRFVLALLIVEALLWLSDRFGWWHKGYAVLTAVVAVGVAMLLLLVWFAVAVVFRRRFQFSIRWLLVLVVVVAAPFSWLAVAMETARAQKQAVDAVPMLYCDVSYEYESQGPREGLAAFRRPPPMPEWLENLFGVDFFFAVITAHVDADGFGRVVTQLKRLTSLRTIYVSGMSTDDTTYAVDKLGPQFPGVKIDVEDTKSQPDMTVPANRDMGLYTFP